MRRSTSLGKCSLQSKRIHANAVTGARGIFTKNSRKSAASIGATRMLVSSTADARNISHEIAVDGDGMSDDFYSLKMTPADYQRWQDARGNVEDATAILETVKRQRATEPRYAVIVEQVKELLVGQPKKIRGHGDMKCGPLRCIEIH